MLEDHVLLKKLFKFVKLFNRNSLEREICDDRNDCQVGRELYWVSLQAPFT